MDNFDQNMRYSDTGMTAQRRHRRRTAENPAAPDTKAADTESIREIQETETAAQAVREVPEMQTAAQAVRRMPESAEAPAGPDAEEAALREETLTTAQSADSRVPAEARRMVAAPYGTVWPEQRKPEQQKP